MFNILKSGAPPTSDDAVPMSQVMQKKDVVLDAGEIASLLESLPWAVAVISSSFEVVAATARWHALAADKDTFEFEVSGSDSRTTLRRVVERALEGEHVRLALEGEGAVDAVAGEDNVVVVIHGREASLAPVLEGALAGSRAARRLLSDFVSRIAAEMRMPLATVTGFSELLTTTPLDERQKRFVRRVRLGATHLDHLLEEVSSRVGSASAPVAGIRLEADELVRTVLRRTVAEGDHVTMSVMPNVPTWIEVEAAGARLAIRRVVEAILDAKAQDDEVSVSVEWTSNGLGVNVDPGADRPIRHVGRWTAADEAAQGVGGTLVLDGARGAARLTIPALEAESSPPPSLEGLRLLIVHSDGASRALALGRAEMLGLNVRGVATAQEAREMVERDSFDLVYASSSLADGSGLEVARSIREQFSMRDLAIVVQGTTESASDLVTAPDQDPISADRFARLLRQAAATKPLPSTSKAVRRVLVVEDDPVNQALVLDMVRVLGVEADLATSGRDALERIRRSRYDAVLMDVMLPEMTGIEVTRRIRSTYGDDLRIVALTALASTADRRRCLAAGMNDFVAKPYRLSRLAEALGVNGPT